MGYGIYSVTSHSARRETLGYDAKATSEVFAQRSINNGMNPFGIKIRESRDSKEHPNSLAIIIALDVTGSMGSVPHHLVKDGLPNIMEGIMKIGIKDPQILFMGIGDHECDRAPLQVAQFESSDELLDKWLTEVYLEGGGGGNYGESYLLAWYFAAKHTALDCFEKRNQKGFLFTIGDEPPLKELPNSNLEKIMGVGLHETVNASILLDLARKTFNVFHINIQQTGSGARAVVFDTWRQLLGDNLLVAQHYDDVSRIITETIKSRLSPENPTEAEVIL